MGPSVVANREQHFRARESQQPDRLFLISWGGNAHQTGLGQASQRETTDTRCSKEDSSLGSLVAHRLVRRTVCVLLALRIALVLDRRLIARGPSTVSKKGVLRFLHL